MGRSCKDTFWFGAAAGAVSLLVMKVWGRLPEAASDLTADEGAELVREAIGEGAASEDGVVMRGRESVV